MYNASGFRTETMYDYYIVMKSMFFVVKLSSTLLLVMQASPFSFHELHINNTKTIKKNKSLSKIKTSILTNIVFIPWLCTRWRCFSRSQTPLYILTKRKLIKNFFKTYPPHGSPCDFTINHKKTTSHGSPCDSTINDKKTTSHGSPCDSTINDQKITSHGSPCDSTINDQKTTSHGSPCDSTINDKKTTSHGSPCDSTINDKKTTSHGSPCDSTINDKKTTSHRSPCDSTINNITWFPMWFHN